jgi:hypothetical protein
VVERKQRPLPLDSKDMPGRCLQGEGGCGKTLWRFEDAGYLRYILTARVYDVAVRILP